jgi:hypothetical protein
VISTGTILAALNVTPGSTEARIQENGITSIGFEFPGGANAFPGNNQEVPPDTPLPLIPRYGIILTRITLNVVYPAGGIISTTDTGDEILCRRMCRVRSF